MTEDSGISEQLRQLISHLEINREKFSKEIGSTAQTIANIVHGANPGYLTILKIHQRYPEVNINWLLFNEGSMLNDNKSSLLDISLSNPKQENAGIRIEALESEIKLLQQIIKNKEEIINAKNELLESYKNSQKK